MLAKHLRILGTLLLTLALAASASAALAADEYVSIKELRESLPERWAGEYTVRKGDGKHLKDGDTVSVDVPVVVPEVDAAPVVRITWGGPYEDLDASLQIGENSRNRLEIKHHMPESTGAGSIIERDVTISDNLSWEAAPNVLLEQLTKYVSSVDRKNLVPFYRIVRGSSEQSRRYYIFYYAAFHDIPYLVGHTFQLRVDSERGSRQADDEPTVPFNITFSSIIESDQFSARISVPKEIGIDVEDTPLLPFSKIQGIFEQRVMDGYVYSLNEVRFGYMAYIDPAKKGEEYVLCPVWAAKGITRTSLSNPFHPNTDPTVLDYNGYNNKAIIVINAQTGEVYDFANDKRPDRLYVPHIITWDEVK